MQLPCGTFSTKYGHDMAFLRTRLQWGLLAAFLILLFIVPLSGNASLVNILNWMGITLIAALGLQILTGYCGQISLGQSAFMAVGAYTSAILTTNLGLSFWIALPCSGISAGVVGLLFGLPSARLKGFYLAMVTLAAQFVIPWVIMHLPKDITGGPYGMQAASPKIGGLTIVTPGQSYIVIMIVTVIMTFFAFNITRTRVGRAFVAIRDNDIAADVMGVNLTRYKLLAFFICSFYAGIAGSLWAHTMRVIHPEFYTLMQSIWFLGILVVGGLGSIGGAILGTLFVRGLEELVNAYTPALVALFPGVIAGAQFSAALLMIVFGAVVALFLIFEPRGLAHRWHILKDYYRLWPFSY